MSHPVLRVKGLGKCYRMFANPTERLWALLGLRDASLTQWALRDINFELKRGQCLGIVGDNGAGKSTLLKLLAGTLQPTHGTVERTGITTAILELGAGFHPDFTGRQNLMFGGSVIGIGQAAMTELAASIVEYSELGEAIDRPVKTYSSGMIVRLAFALVTAVQPEVLIIDEALSVGDQHFQKKCIQRIEKYRENGCTILFCSHSLYHVRQLCDHALWLEKGDAKAFGEVEGVLADYRTHVRLQDSAKKDPAAAQQSQNIERHIQSDLLAWNSTGRQAGLVRAEVNGLKQQPKGAPAQPLFEADLVITIEAATRNNETPSIGVMLEQYKGTGITSVATHADAVSPTKVGESDGFALWQITICFNDLPLHSGEYSLSFYLFDNLGIVVYDEWKDYIQFQWISPSLTPGLVRLPHKWT